MAPHVHVNVAMTLDGCVGGPGRTPLRISHGADLRRVHALRASVDAVLVGVGTVLADDPKLTVKWDLAGGSGRDPLRVVLDPALRTPASAQVLRGGAPTLLLARPDAPARAGVEVERVPAAGGELDLAAALDRLEARGVRRLLVEGGPRTLRRFFEQERVDAFTLFVAPTVLGSADAPRLFEAPLDLRRRLRMEAATRLGDGVLLSFVRA